jgi:hypothetical protein
VLTPSSADLATDAGMKKKNGYSGSAGWICSEVLHVFNSPLPLSVFYLPLFPLFFVAFIAMVFIAVNWCRYYHLLTQNAGHQPTPPQTQDWKRKTAIRGRLDEFVLRSCMSSIRRCRYRSSICRYFHYFSLPLLPWSLLPLIDAVIIIYWLRMPNITRRGAMRRDV